MNSIERSIADVVRRTVEAALADHQGVERVAYSIPEAAESLGVSPDMVRRLVAEGRLPIIDMGARRLLVPVVALRRFAAENAVAEGTTVGEVPAA